MKGRSSLGLGLLVVVLIAGRATAAPQVLITMDEYGSVLLTRDGVTSRLIGGVPLTGGGIRIPWESWGLAGDITSGTVRLLENGTVSDSIIFNNAFGVIEWYSDGTNGFDSPADHLPPLPQGAPTLGGGTRDILEVGPPGNNEAFYHAPDMSMSPGNLRGLDTFYHFISGGRIPEPPSLLLLISGFVGLAGMEWRRHRQN